MKYLVVEVSNNNMIEHPSGIMVSDGDDNLFIRLGRVGNTYSTWKDAISAIDKHIRELSELIRDSGELNDGWYVDYSTLDKSVEVYKYGPSGDIEESEWVICCDVVELPEYEGEKGDNFCFLDIAKYWWG